jgi:hypothetical protein
MEVMILTNENTRTALYQAGGAETAEEIIGVLTAISVVSKRMAKKQALLEQRPVSGRQSAEKEGVTAYGKAAV